MKKLLFLFLISLGANIHAVKIGSEHQSFLKKYCYECHDEDVRKGDLDLTSLSFSLTDHSSFQKWMDVYSKVQEGDMPPKKKTQPQKNEKSNFLDYLEKNLLAAEEESHKKYGRSRLRRMNRYEFQATLEDLFGVKLNIIDDLPEDAKSHGFDNIGSALNVSAVQIEAYMNTLDKVLDKVTTLYKKPLRHKYELALLQSPGIMEEYRITNAFLVTDKGPVFFSPQKYAYMNPVLEHYVVPHDGKYKVSVQAQAINSKEPLTLKVRLGGEGYGENDNIPKTVLGYSSVSSQEMQQFDYENDLFLGQYFRIYPATLRYLRFFTDQWKGRQKAYKGPGILVHKVIVDGPIIDSWPLVGHKLLWGGVQTKAIQGLKKNRGPNFQLDKAPRIKAVPRDLPSKQRADLTKYLHLGGQKIYRRAKAPKSIEDTFELTPENPEADAQKLIARFLPIAFRRTVNEEEIQVYTKLVAYWLDQGVSFEESMRTGYKAILTAPEFLYQKSSLEKVQNADMKLSPLALSERLSYFLWSSQPDEQLLKLAASGEILKDAVLYKQVERMLKDAKSERFVENFLGQWLDLRQMNFTSPDSILYPEHDAELQWSMKEEVHSFFRELITNDLSVRNIIDSDFLTINERLAKHYNLPPVKGTHMRKVKLPANSPRGGILGMAAIHKVTANGVTTSPVVRGVWMLERMMGITPPAPPSGIPAIEPDIRGAVSVLDQLLKHRSDKRCQSCHLLIDPLGVAMESFDVIGQWRSKYRILAKKVQNDGQRLNPGVTLKKSYRLGPDVVSKGILKDGRSFKDFNEFKNLLLEQPDAIAMNVAEKLITYGTGASVGLSDKKELMQIISKLKPNGTGLRTMIHEIVKSKIFQRK